MDNGIHHHLLQGGSRDIGVVITHSFDVLPTLEEWCSVFLLAALVVSQGSTTGGTKNHTGKPVLRSHDASLSAEAACGACFCKKTSGSSKGICRYNGFVLAIGQDHVSCILAPVLVPVVEVPSDLADIKRILQNIGNGPGFPSTAPVGGDPLPV